MESTGHYELVDENGVVPHKLVGAANPFDCVTIASVCMGILKIKFLEETWRVKLDDLTADWSPAKLVHGKFSVWHIGEWVNEEELTDMTIIKKEFEF